MNKRVLGYSNLRFRRGKTHLKKQLVHLLSQLQQEALDQVVITGDISNLALNFEYENISSLLMQAGIKPDSTMIIPGNHDRYTALADLRGAFETHMRHWLPDDFSRRNGYPVTRDVGPIRIIAIDTAVWRGPVRAAGRITTKGVQQIGDAIDKAHDTERWPVVAMHHPPFRLNGKLLKHYRNGLAGLDQFHQTLSSKRATILHGHLHVTKHYQMGNLDILGVASASNGAQRDERQSAYNIYEFGSKGLVNTQTVRCYPERSAQYQSEREPLQIHKLKSHKLKRPEQ